jgi:transcriptional regulator with XRE-family HTH domain
MQSQFANKNLSELSRQLNIPRSVLQDWIKDEREPSFKNLEYLKAIAEHLGLTLDELFIGEQESKILSSITFEDEGRKYQILINRIK